MILQLASIPESVANLKFIIQASVPQSNDVISAYSKADSFADPYTPVATAIDIKAAYDAKNGAPTAAVPKVFFKWFYVNTTTGEKSGEMMGYAKLAEWTKPYYESPRSAAKLGGDFYISFVIFSYIWNLIC